MFDDSASPPADAVQTHITHRGSGKHGAERGQRVALNTAAQFGGQLLASALGVVVLKLMTRYLGVAEYGIYATAFVYVVTFTLFTDLGLNVITPRELARTPERASHIIGHNLGLRLVACVVIIPIAIGVAFAIYPHEPAKLHISIAILTAVLFAETTRATVYALLIVQARSYLVAIANVVQQATFVVGAIVSIFAHFGLYGFVVSYPASYLISAVLCAFFVRRHTSLRPRIDLREWAATLRSSFSVGLLQILNFLYFKADAIIVSLLIGTTAVGVYNVSYSLLNAFLGVPSYLLGALTAQLVNANRRELTALVQRAYVVLSICGTLLVALAFAVREPVIVLVSSTAFRGAATPFVILCIGLMFGYLANVFAYSVVMTDHQRVLLRVSVTLLLLNAALNVAIIPHYGIAGSAWATAFTELVSVLFTYRVFSRATGVRLELLRGWLRPAIAMGVSVGVALLLHAQLRSLSPWPALFAGGALAGAVYAVVVLALFGGPRRLVAAVKGAPSTTEADTLAAPA